MNSSSSFFSLHRFAPKMSTRQTRRKSAKLREEAAAAVDDEHHHQQQQEAIVVNGNGLTRHGGAVASDPVASENIFLFWPNIIGAR